MTTSAGIEIGIDGVRIGHWTDPVGRTGCTVVLFPDGTVASGEVRGGAPASREFELLAPARTVERIDALVLSGGSAFGLAAADGVMRHLEAQGVGFPTGVGVVPIVVGLSLFDLLVGDATARPTAADGRAAAEAAGSSFAVGDVGAGTGATVGTWRGRDRATAGGIGAAVLRRGALTVAALFAVNAFGDVDDGRPIADRYAAGDVPNGWAGIELPDAFGHTTIGLIVTNAGLRKADCHLVAQGAHDGFARALVPAHTRVDGDAVVAAATGSLAHDVAVDEVRLLAVAATEQAIRTATPPPPPT